MYCRTSIKERERPKVKSHHCLGRNQKNQNAWKHKFLCLAYCDQTRIPTTDVEKDDLLQAGLGEKEIFKDIDIDAEEFRDVII